MCVCVCMFSLHSGAEGSYRCLVQQIRIICLPQRAWCFHACLCVLHVSAFLLCLCDRLCVDVSMCVRVCVSVCVFEEETPASSRVIRHAALVTGNGVADGQAECIIDECHALAAPSPRRISLNFLSEWQKKPRTISLIRSICLTAPYPFNPPIQ